MKIPGSDVHIHLPAWPNDFDVMGCLHAGVHVKVDRKTGEISFRVDSASPQESTISARTREEGSE
jgi:hypothetical protein